jgi:hypothetical protein
VIRWEITPVGWIGNCHTIGDLHDFEGVAGEQQKAEGDISASGLKIGMMLSG